MTRLLERLRIQGDLNSQPPIHEPTTAGAVPDVVRQSATAESLDIPQVVAVVRRSLLDGDSQLLDVPFDIDRLTTAVKDILCRDSLVVSGLTREALATTVVTEIAGFGPLDTLLKDPLVTDVMINCPDEVYCERAGALQRSDCGFRDEAHLRNTIMRILAPLGRRVDNLNPYVDARLPDGSRLNVVIPPLATRGWTLTIRRFREDPMTIDDLADAGFAPPVVLSLLRAMVEARLNVLVSGCAGSGKTTLLNAMCMCVAADSERLITIEDAQELRVVGVHHVSLEARPPNLEGLGEVTIRQLVRNALRMRPDRLVIGEVRDGSAYDFLQAINTGHNGSMCTVHANSGTDALYRMENLALTSGSNLVLRAIRDQLLAALDVVVHLIRDEAGHRRISEISLVSGTSDQLEAIEIARPSSGELDPLKGLIARVERRSTKERGIMISRLARRAREEAL